MLLPLHTRALALVAALSISAAIVATVAEVGHPAPDGYVAAALLWTPGTASDARSVPQPDAALAAEPVALAGMPQP